eukprot:6209360-Pleurochrysis_carterae.AAC.2
MLGNAPSCAQAGAMLAMSWAAFASRAYFCRRACKSATRPLTMSEARARLPECRFSRSNLVRLIDETETSTMGEDEVMMLRVTRQSGMRLWVTHRQR